MNKLIWCDRLNNNAISYLLCFLMLISNKTESRLVENMGTIHNSQANLLKIKL